MTSSTGPKPSQTQAQPGSRAAWHQHTAVRTQKGCRQLFILYQGLAGRMMMDPMQFLHQARLTDRNLIMIRDNSRSYYQHGLGPDVPDMASFIAWQQKLISRITHAPDLYCVGSSSGAYAALLSGHLLKARAVFAFAPPTDLSPLLAQEKVDCPDRRYVDLKPVLAESNGVTKFHVFYNEASQVDRNAAQHLAGCPNVELHSEGGPGHGVIIHLAKSGRLQTLLPQFEAVTT